MCCALCIVVSVLSISDAYDWADTVGQLNLLFLSTTLVWAWSGWPQSLEVHQQLMQLSEIQKHITCNSTRKPQDCDAVLELNTKFQLCNKIEVTTLVRSGCFC